MSHINYFEPYDNKGGNHEDQLTRAFLVVLRYCPLALLKFYDAVIDAAQQEAYRMEVSRPNVLSASKLPLDDVYFDTQRSSLPENTS